MGYSYIKNINELGYFLEELSITSVLEVDTETTGLDCLSDDLILLQVRTKNHIFIFDFKSLGRDNFKYVLELMNIPRVTKILHNAKFDIKFLLDKTGVLLTNIYCTQTAERQLTLGIGDFYPSLKSLVKKYCNIDLSKESRELFYKDFDGNITEEMLIYSALDVSYMETIREKQLALAEESKQTNIIDLEMQLLPVICHMEHTGVKLDRDEWLELTTKETHIVAETGVMLQKEFAEKVISKGYNNALDAIQEVGITKIDGKDVNRVFMKKYLSEISDLSFIRDLLERNINLSSNPQMLNILTKFYDIKIKDTNEKTLNKVDNPIIKRILEFREAEKKVSTYGEEFLKNVHPKDNKIHTTYNQIGGRSGRFSSDSPNLQNIPAITEYRKPFKPDDDTWTFVGADYSQQELRVLAVVSRETNLINAFLNGVDPHKNTASLIFNVPVEEVTKYQRSRGKTLNFAVVYGSSEYGLERNFGISQEEGKQLLNDFYTKAYPTFAKFKEVAGEMIWKRGYSVTPLGRKRYFQKKVMYEDWKELRKEKGKVIRSGINHIIQGGSADITKIALINIFYNNPFGDKLKIVLQVHDEIVCMVKKEIAELAKEFVVKQMLDAERVILKDIVPAEVDAYICDYWKKG